MLVDVHAEITEGNADEQNARYAQRHSGNLHLAQNNAEGDDQRQHQHRMSHTASPKRLGTKQQPFEQFHTESRFRPSCPRKAKPVCRKRHSSPKNNLGIKIIMQYTTDIECPFLGVLRRRIDLAGLLTDSCSEAFPVVRPVAKMFGTFCGASQQRDCPGFTPDSLFIPSPVRGTGNQI